MHGLTLSTDASDGDDIFPVGMIEVMNKANLLFSTKLASVVIAERAPFVIMEINGTQPSPTRLGAARSAVERSHWNQDNPEIQNGATRKGVENKALH